MRRVPAAPSGGLTHGDKNMKRPIPFDRIKINAVVVIFVIFIIVVVPIFLVWLNIVSSKWLYIYPISFGLAALGILWEFVRPARFAQRSVLSILNGLLGHMIVGVFVGAMLVKVVAGVGLVLPTPYVGMAGFVIYCGAVICFGYITRPRSR